MTPRHGALLLATATALAAIALPGASAATVARGAAAAVVRAEDITADIRAGRSLTLSGDAVVTVPAGTTTYGGVISGGGTLRITGSGTLILTKDSDFTLPRAKQRQRVQILR